MPATDSGTAAHRLGRYHLSECLGGGPTGEVYRAKVYGIAGMERDFAVKRFHPSFVVGSAAAAEIAVAAQLYGSLDHPKVAKLQELGVSGDHTFTAVEFVPGLDLSQIMDHGKLPLGAAARLVVQLCRTIAYAHSRGLTHLGIAPTNVICSERGEIKVTDFGFLAPRLPKRPAEDVSLLARLCYLAPEQLEGKPVSPATDVYQLGSIAFELMVGRKPYAGRSGIALAKQMLLGSIPASGLAAPYQKLLNRALARNPFERFPDAGAMADAMEAALRASPAEGTLEDVGIAVGEREVFLATSRETEASGALSFPMPAPPKESRSVAIKMTKPPPLGRSNGHSSLARLKLQKKPVVRGAQEKVSAKRLQPRKAKEEKSQPAMAPVDSASIDDAWDMDDLVGTEATASEDTVPSAHIPPPAEEPADAASPQEGDTIPTMDAPVHAPDAEKRDASGLLLGPAGTDSGASASQFIGGEERPLKIEKTMPGGHGIPRTPPPPIPGQSSSAEVDDADLVMMEAEEIADDEPPTADSGDALDEAAQKSKQTLRGPGPALELAQPSPAATTSSPPQEDPVATPPPSGAEAIIQSMPAPLQYIGMAAIFVGFAYLSFSLLALNDDRRPARSAQGQVALGAGAAVADDDPSTEEDRVAEEDPKDLSAALAVPADAAAAPSTRTGPDASTSAAAEQDPSPLPIPTEGGGLQVVSQPAGAKVYLDGSLVGNTPLELESSADTHRLALVMAGHDLYTGEIEGKGTFSIDLDEVTPPGGPGGIKVRCKKQNRYYVYVDGNPVGQLCPTERIGVARGKHLVEIYDPVTDSRREFKLEVVETRLSVRVRVD